MCDEIVEKWPRGSARYTPLMVKADCLAALGKTNDAVRAYREHYTKHNPDAHVTDEDIRKRMEAVEKKIPTTGRTVPPKTGFSGVQ